MANQFDFSMPLSQAMETQRAIRRLKPDPVDEALIMRLIELALKAPTGSNAQSWEFIVVRDPRLKQGLARLNRQLWGIYGRIGRWVTRNDPKRSRLLEAVQWQADHFAETPVIIVACLKGGFIPFVHLSATTYFGSIYPAVQNLLLAARAINLGAALTTIPIWNLIAARRLLGLPWNVTPCAVIPLGWPIGRYGPTTRKPVYAVVSFDRYGNRPGVVEVEFKPAEYLVEGLSLSFRNRNTLEECNETKACSRKLIGINVAPGHFHGGMWRARIR